MAATDTKAPTPTSISRFTVPHERNEFIALWIELLDCHAHCRSIGNPSLWVDSTLGELLADMEYDHPEWALQAAANRKLRAKIDARRARRHHRTA